jgi:hypothetical protein
MKKFLVVVGLILIAMPVYAQSRGPLTNVYASIASVAANSNKTFTFPFQSRDVYILNDSGQKICVSPKGETIAIDVPTGYCTVPTGNIFQMATGTQVALYDLVTDAVSVRNTGAAAASPVSVIVGY